MKILSCIVVDDELSAIERLVKLISIIKRLKILGTYTDPVIALTQILMGCPEIVFLDIEMPKLNGFELKAKLENLRVNTKLIFVTGNLNNLMTLSTIKGINYLVKPVDIDELIECISVI